MVDNSVADKLRALAVSNANRSETARLGDILNEIENALKAGVHRAAILQTLNDSGFKMNMKSFESALHRLRKKRKGEGGRKEESGHGQQSPAPAQPPAPAAGARLTAPSPRVGQNPDEPQRARNPNDLKRAREVEVDLKAISRNAKHTPPETTEKG